MGSDAAIGEFFLDIVNGCNFTLIVGFRAKMSLVVLPSGCGSRDSMFNWSGIHPSSGEMTQYMVSAIVPLGAFDGNHVPTDSTTQIRSHLGGCWRRWNRYRHPPH